MKKFAVFCPVKNETLFSPIWLEYYSRFLPTEDIYFLDFGSDTKPSGCSVVNIDKNICDANELFESIKDFHKELLKEYEYVIPTDVDEIIFHKDGLDNYINNLNKGQAKCAGFEIIHLPEVEPDLDKSKSIFSQRNFWFRSPVYYDKTLITNKPLDWTIGLHTCKDSNEPVDIDLLLIHLHRFDYKTCIERHLRFSKLNWSENTIRNNYNWHYRSEEEQKVKDWYFSTDFNIKEIPEYIKELIKI